MEHRVKQYHTKQVKKHAMGCLCASSICCNEKWETIYKMHDGQKQKNVFVINI
jgi:hypothetical protein